MGKEEQDLLKTREERELEMFSELLSMEFCDFRLSTLAQKIKVDCYKPKLKTVNL